MDFLISYRKCTHVQTRPIDCIECMCNISSYRRGSVHDTFLSATGSLNSYLVVTLYGTSFRSQVSGRKYIDNVSSYAWCNPCLPSSLPAPQYRNSLQRCRRLRL